MPFTWKLNESHDLSIVSGKFETVDGAEEIKQRIYVSLLHHYQEYFANVPAGVPWYEYVLGNKDKRSVELLLQRAILAVPGVVGVVSLRTILADRTLDLWADVEVTTGAVVSINISQ